MRAVAAVSFAALAACSGESLQPGYWETRSELAGASRTMSRCIDATEAADPADGLLRTAVWGQCQVIESQFSGGVISARGDCTGFTRDIVPQAVRTRVSLEGHYTETTIEARITATGADEPGAAPQAGTVTSRRIRDCPT